MLQLRAQLIVGADGTQLVQDNAQVERRIALREQ